MRRRTLLTAIGGLAAGSTAGCLSAPGGSTPSATATRTDSGPHPMTPAEQSFAVLDRPCGQGEDAATVEFGDGSVAVDGVIAGRDTCDTAALASASLRDGVLTVTVGVVAESPTATIACAECLTDIEYAYRAWALGDGPDRVRVVHRSADGERTVAVADRP